MGMKDFVKTERLDKGKNKFYYVNWHETLY
jgi:hypothetical protein